MPAPGGGLRLPAPALADELVRLRPWTAGDADTLAAAWLDPDIAAETSVPAEPSAGAARRWITAAPARLAVGAALDLVVSPADGDEVWGEVGLVRLRLRSEGREVTAWEVGWWVAASARGRGVATRATALLVGWADAELAPGTLVARIRDQNAASVAVARGQGLVRRGRAADGRALWSRPLGSAPGPGVGSA